jgi:hypothetical protein
MNMASIRVRQRADGSYSYTAILRRRKGKTLTHEEVQTFSSRQAAESWAEGHDKELDDPFHHIRARPGEPTLASWMKYHSMHHVHFPEWQRNKTTPLDYLQNWPIGQVNPYKLTPSALVHHLKSRKDSGIAATTANNDLIWIGRVLTQRSLLGIVNQPKIDVGVVSEAREQSKKLRLIGKRLRRHRRPTAAELETLGALFQHPAPQQKIPMYDVMWFAIHSGRSQTEITELRWADNDHSTRTGAFPRLDGGARGSFGWRRFRYTPEAWDIVQRQPKCDGRIFPFAASGIFTAFRKACVLLNISDLKFRDLQFAAYCRLFERGMLLDEIAQHVVADAPSTLLACQRFVKDKSRI